MRGFVPNLKKLPLPIVATLMSIASIFVSECARAESQVVVETVAEGTHTGTLLKITPNTITFREGDATRVIATDDLLWVAFDHPAREPAGGGLVRLANGDHLYARPEKIDETHLTARWTVEADRPAVRIPLEAVRDVLFDLPRAAVRRRELFAAIGRASDSGDIALLTNGDRIAGELVGLDAESLVLQVGDEPFRIARSTLRGIRFDPELVGLPSAKGKRVIVESTDGSWITGRAPQLKAGRLAIEAEFRGALELPLETVHAIRFLGGRATYVSDLEPSAYRHTPYLGSGKNGSLVRPAEIDRSIAGDVLRLRGVSFPKGLGLPGGAEIRYDLEERYRGFQAVIGIDDATEGGGHAVFVVETDGERIYESPPLTGRSPAVKVGPLDLTGARTLTLRVEYGARGDILDYADWAEAVIFR